MRVFSGTVFVAILLATFCTSGAVAGQQRPKADQLISLRDLDTSVSIGNYYLKQESLVSIRSYLARLGRDENLGAGWNNGNPWWRQAEE